MRARPRPCGHCLQTRTCEFMLLARFASGVASRRSDHFAVESFAPSQVFSGSMGTVPLQVGDLVAGKYRLERELGTGGMGVVYAATHTLLDQKVALKFLFADAAKNTELVERFW